MLGPGQGIPLSIAAEPSAKDLAEEKKPSAKVLPVQVRTPITQRLRSHNRTDDPLQGA